MQRKRTLAQQDALVALLLILPSRLIILGISLQPILSTLYLSLFEAPRGIDVKNTFVGLANYITLLSDPVFWVTIRRTLYFTVVSVGLELILGLAIAQLIHSRPPGWQFLRTRLIIPWAVPTIVNGTMWRWIYNADYGTLNGLHVERKKIKNAKHSFHRKSCEKDIVTILTWRTCSVYEKIPSRGNALPIRGSGGFSRSFSA